MLLIPVMWFTWKSIVVRKMEVIPKVLHMANARPLQWCDQFEICVSCKSDFRLKDYMYVCWLAWLCADQISFKIEEKTESGWISHSDQRFYIKIETLWGKNLTEVENTLREVCADSVLDHSNASQWYACSTQGDKWRQVWSIFESHTAWADHITCGMSICIVVREKVEVRVTVCVTVHSCVVECGMMMMMKGREKVKPSAGS